MSKKAKVMYVNHCTVRNPDLFQCFCDTTQTGQTLLSAGGARWVPGSLTSGTISAQSSRFPDLSTPTTSSRSSRETSRVWGHSPRTKPPGRGNPAHVSAAALTSAHPRVFALPQTHPNPLKLAYGAKWQSLSTFKALQFGAII